MEYNNTMSKDWVKDINDMHAKYGVHDWVENEKSNGGDWSRLQKFLDFRLSFLQEELDDLN